MPPENCESQIPAPNYSQKAVLKNTAQFYSCPSETLPVTLCEKYYNFINPSSRNTNILELITLNEPKIYNE